MTEFFSGRAYRFDADGTAYYLRTALCQKEIGEKSEPRAAPGVSMRYLLVATGKYSIETGRDIPVMSERYLQ